MLAQATNKRVELRQPACWLETAFQFFSWDNIRPKFGLGSRVDGGRWEREAIRTLALAVAAALLRTRNPVLKERPGEMETMKKASTER